MKVVEKAALQPGLCALTHDTTGPFVDTERAINCERVGINPHIYIHLPVAEEIGRAADMIPERVLHSAEQTINELRERNQELEAECSRLTAALDAVDTLKNRGFEQKRGPGRPRKPRHESEVAA